MYAAQRGLYNYKSTINQFAEPFQQFIYEEGPYPFTNANLTGLSPNLSGQQSEGGDDYIHQDLPSKENLRSMTCLPIKSKHYLLKPCLTH